MEHKVMQRLFEDDIDDWYYNSGTNQYLVVLGTRQVGKTAGIINWANIKNVNLVYISYNAKL